MEQQLKRIVIVGGGTAGWMTAAAFAKLLPASNYSITLVESSQIGTVGVGEATIPHIRQFNSMLGIDENEFIRATNASYKLAIKFENWGQIGSSYMHPFGEFGHDLNGIEFHHYWLKLHQEGLAKPLGNYSMPIVAANYQRFDYPSADLNSPLSTYAYAFHIDASLYARFLRQYSEARNVLRKEAIVAQVDVNPATGDIAGLRLDNDEYLSADFFVDCSGFRGLLIESILETGFEDWSHWLPCDRAVAIPNEKIATPAAYTQSIAREAGWQWRIPLQHRTGNGYVYSSRYISDEEALNTLLVNLDAPPTDKPNFLKFTAGRRKKSWNKNCVAFGLSSGFLEPLESTSIYLIQMGILKFIEFFPEDGESRDLQEEFNRVMEMEYVRIRDFLILHYYATTRDDTPFWRYCKAMSIPDSLQQKIDLFKSSAHVEKYQQGLFMTPSWLALYIGQGVIPDSYDSRLQHIPVEKIAAYFERLAGEFTDAAKRLPDIEFALEKTLLNQAIIYPKSALSLYGVN